MTLSEEQPYPGESLGLPASGAGSLASWRARVAALIGDWAASMVAAVGMFGWGVMTQSGWKSFAILGVYFVQASVLTALLGGSFGQLIARIGVMRLAGGPVGWLRSFARTGLKCLALPGMVVGAERRTLVDLVVGTVVVRRR